MCTNRRFIYNKYIRKSVLVPCGKCDACLQTKANKRAQLIRNNSSSDLLCLMVTLTYDNHYVPYIKQSDLQKCCVSYVMDNLQDEILRQCLGVSCDEFISVKLSTTDEFGYSPVLGYTSDSCSCHSTFASLDGFKVPIYRDYTVRWYRNTCFTSKLSNPIAYVNSFDIDYSKGDFIPILTKKRGCVGISLYSDVQKFLKRLRQILSRSGYEIYLVHFWSVSEYGETYYRPHFHLLLYFNKGSVETLRSIIAKAWPFGDVLRTPKRVQVAINPANYLSSYLNKSVGVPKICKSVAFKTSYSHSRHFGFSPHPFALHSLLESADRGSLSYSYEQIKDGVPVLVNAPVPNYVITRYFPKFKGYSLLAPDEVRLVLLYPEKLWDYFGDSVVSSSFDTSDFADVGHVIHHVIHVSPHKDLLIHLSLDEFNAWCRKIQRAFDYYHDVTGKSGFDYVIDYMRVWTCWYSTVLRHSLADVIDFSNHYFNIHDFVMLHGKENAPTLFGLESNSFNHDYNSLSDIVERDRKLRVQFVKQQNIRKVNSMILSSIYDDL